MLSLRYLWYVSAYKGFIIIIMSANLGDVDLFSWVAPDLKFLVVSFNVLRDTHNTHLMNIRREICLFLIYLFILRKNQELSIRGSNNYMKDLVLDYKWNCKCQIFDMISI